MDSDAKSPPAPASKRVKGKKPLGKATKPQFILTTVHLLKVQAERLLQPEEASKGYFTVAQSCKNIWTLEKPKTIGKFHYEIIVEGFSETSRDIEEGEINKDPPKSFSIELALEANFNILNGPIRTESQLNSAGPEMIGQVHALAISRVTALAAELGYLGIRPELTLERTDIPSFGPDDSPD
jgi:hypothetical protein